MTYYNKCLYVKNTYETLSNNSAEHVRYNFNGLTLTVNVIQR